MIEEIKKEIIDILSYDFSDYLGEFAVEVVSGENPMTAIVTTKKGAVFTATDNLISALPVRLWRQVAHEWIADPNADHGEVTEKPTPRYTGHAENFRRPKSISEKEADIRHKLAFGFKVIALAIVSFLEFYNA